MSYEDIEYPEIFYALPTEKLDIVFHLDYYDGPLTGICRYDGKLQWFSVLDDYFYYCPRCNTTDRSVISVCDGYSWDYVGQHVDKHRDNYEKMPSPDPSLICNSERYFIWNVFETPRHIVWWKVFWHFWWELVYADFKKYGRESWQWKVSSYIHYKFLSKISGLVDTSWKRREREGWKILATVS